VQAVTTKALTKLPLDLLRCPETGAKLIAAEDGLVASSGRRYRIAPIGIPLFAEQPGAGDAQQQMVHYEKFAAAYEANLGYPHTQAYFSYLDEALLAAVAADRSGSSSRSVAAWVRHSSFSPAATTRALG